MEEALRSYLLANSAVNAACGGRVSWAVRNQAQGLPAIVLTAVSRVPVPSYSGPSGYADSRIQIDCYATTYIAAKALFRLVKPLLNTIRFNYSGIRFEAFALNERDLTESGTTDAARVFRVSADFQIWHEE